MHWKRRRGRLQGKHKKHLKMRLLKRKYQAKPKGRESLRSTEKSVRRRIKSLRKSLSSEERMVSRPPPARRKRRPRLKKFLLPREIKMKMMTSRRLMNFLGKPRMPRKEKKTLLRP
jgi:hypothetical protein